MLEPSRLDCEDVQEVGKDLIIIILITEIPYLCIRSFDPHTTLYNKATKELFSFIETCAQE